MKGYIKGINVGFKLVVLGDVVNFIIFFGYFVSLIDNLEELIEEIMIWGFDCKVKVLKN